MFGMAVQYATVRPGALDNAGEWRSGRIVDNSHPAELKCLRNEDKLLGRVSVNGYCGHENPVLCNITGSERSCLFHFSLDVR